MKFRMILFRRESIRKSNKSRSYFLPWKRSWHDYQLEAWLQFILEIKNNFRCTNKPLKEGIDIEEVLMEWLTHMINR
jgi:hypothetical protein